MRVAVRHTDEEHPNGQWFAYGEGRILGFTHPIERKSYTPEQVADGLLKAAKQDYPEKDGYEHRIETLHVGGADENGDEVGEWHPIGESDLPRVGQGAVTSHDIEVDQGQKGGNA